MKDSFESDTSDTSDTKKERVRFQQQHFVFTSLITDAAQRLIEANELDIDATRITSSRVGRVLNKMRLNKSRQPLTGKRGWSVSLDDVIRWAYSYGLDPAAITGIKQASHLSSVISVTGVTSVTCILNLHPEQF